MIMCNGQDSNKIAMGDERAASSHASLHDSIKGTTVLAYIIPNFYLSFDLNVNRLDRTITDFGAELITTYHDLNRSIIDELKEEPSPLDFMRYVSRNRPFVVRKGAKGWPACRKWNADYLRQTMEGQSVNVAMTPLGQVDAVHLCNVATQEHTNRMKKRRCAVRT